MECGINPIREFSCFSFSAKIEVERVGQAVARTYSATKSISLATRNQLPPDQTRHTVGSMKKMKRIEVLLIVFLFYSLIFGVVRARLTAPLPPSGIEMNDPMNSRFAEGIYTIVSEKVAALKRNLCASSEESYKPSSPAELFIGLSHLSEY